MPAHKKPAEQVRRTNDDGTEPVQGEARRYTPPPPSEQWHPVATQLYEAAANSGQVDFYAASDWALVYLLAESISRELKPQCVGVDDEGKPIMRTVPIKGQNLSAYTKLMTELLFTESARKRMRIELTKPTGDPDADAADGAVASLMSKLTA